MAPLHGPHKTNFAFTGFGLIKSKDTIAKNTKQIASDKAELQKLLSGEQTDENKAKIASLQAGIKKAEETNRGEQREINRANMAQATEEAKIANAAKVAEISKEKKQLQEKLEGTNDPAKKSEIQAQMAAAKRAEEYEKSGQVPTTGGKLNIGDDQF